MVWMSNTVATQKLYKAIETLLIFLHRQALVLTSVCP